MKKVLSRIFIGLFVVLLIGGAIVGGLYLSGRKKLRSEVLAGEDLSAIGGFEDPIPTETLPVMVIDEEGNLTMVDENGEIVVEPAPTIVGSEDQAGAEAAPGQEPAATVVDTVPANTVAVTDDEDGVVTYKGQRYRYNEDLVTILVMGVDRMSEVTAAAHGADGGQADAVFLLLLDGSSGQINVVAINRNSMVQVDTYNRDGSYAGTGSLQLALQHAYGDGMGVSNSRMAEAVSRMFHNIPIHAYASMNMAGIAPLNDAIGGVTLTPIMDVPYNPNIKQGQQITLMGQDAYDYVHWRDWEHEFASADKRLEREKQYLSIFGKKVLSQIKSDPTVVTTLYSTVQKYLVTDLSLDRITYLAAECGGYRFDADNIYSVPGTTRMGFMYEEYIVDEEGLRELIINLFFKKI